MDLIYINSGIGSVFASQVAALLEYFSRSEKFERVQLLCGVRNAVEEELARMQLAGSAFTITYFKTYPNYSPFNICQQRRLSAAIRKAGPAGKSIFHIRGEGIAYHAMKGILAATDSLERVIVDVRGASREEVLLFQKTNPILKPLKRSNINGSLKYLDCFKKISVVSPALKSYMLGNTSVKNSCISVIPCLASVDFVYSEADRVKFREQLGLTPDEHLFVFTSAGTAGWQSSGILPGIANKGWKVLNLSPNIIDHPNVINKFIPYRDVPGYLSAADIAVIFRDASIVNKVASPVKFSEYTCSGLPVISNGNVDFVTDYIRETGFGATLGSVSEIEPELIDKLIHLPRAAISAEGTKRTGIESVAKRYFDIYQEAGIDDISTG
jgi:hypothetical protein